MSQEISQLPTLITILINFLIAQVTINSIVNAATQSSTIPSHATMPPIETRSRKPIPLLQFSDHTCGHGEYKCMNGLCILSRWQCDNYDDCGDWSDEYNCPLDTFPNGTIKPVQKSSQSGNEVGPSPVFMKRMGAIMPYGSNHGNIRVASVKGCPAERFDCGNNGQCITKDFICDSDPDCANDRDELNCDTNGIIGQRTKEGNNKVSTGVQSKVSTGQKNPFLSPTLNVPFTPPRSPSLSFQHATLSHLDNAMAGQSIKCKEGNEFKCIPNGQQHTSGVQSERFQNRETKRSITRLEICLPITSICDSIIDCIDGSDESDCTGNDVYCGLDAYTCKNYQCIKDTKVCDKVNDCIDGSDELNCVYCDPKTQFACAYGPERGRKTYKCIPKRYLCDSFKDCDDASDETLDECPISEFKPARKLSSPINESSINYGPLIRTQLINNPANSNNRVPSNPNLNKPKAGLAPVNNYTTALGNGTSVSKVASLSIVSKRERVQSEDSNRIYNLNLPNYNSYGKSTYNKNPYFPNSYNPSRNVDTSSEEDTRSSSEYKPLRRLPTTGGQCSYNQFHCRSDGSCIMNRYICDGRKDCRDGSDEEGCSDHEHDAEQLRKFPTQDNYQDYNYGNRRPPPQIDTEELARQRHIEQQRLLHQRILGQNSRGQNGHRFPPNPPKEGIDLQVYDTPQTQFVGYDVVFRCRDEGSARSGVKWYRQDGKPLPTTSTDIDGRLTMYHVTMEEAGIYVCGTTSGQYPIAEREATLTVSPRSLLENLRSYSFCSTEFQRRKKK